MLVLFSHYFYKEINIHTYIQGISVLIISILDLAVKSCDWPINKLLEAVFVLLMFTYYSVMFTCVQWQKKLEFIEDVVNFVTLSVMHYCYLVQILLCPEKWVTFSEHSRRPPKDHSFYSTQQTHWLLFKSI